MESNNVSFFLSGFFLLALCLWDSSVVAFIHGLFFYFWGELVENWQGRTKGNILEWWKHSVSWEVCGLHLSVFVSTHPIIYTLQCMCFTICKLYLNQRIKGKKHLLQDWMYYFSSHKCLFFAAVSCASFLILSSLPSLSPFFDCLPDPLSHSSYVFFMCLQRLHMLHHWEEAVYLLAYFSQETRIPWGWGVSLK